MVKPVDKELKRIRIELNEMHFEGIFVVIGVQIRAHVLLKKPAGRS